MTLVCTLTRAGTRSRRKVVDAEAAAAAETRAHEAAGTKRLAAEQLATTPHSPAAEKTSRGIKTCEPPDGAKRRTGLASAAADEAWSARPRRRSTSPRYERLGTAERSRRPGPEPLVPALTDAA
jgi:hypothetical protein